MSGPSPIYGPAPGMSTITLCMFVISTSTKARPLQPIFVFVFAYQTKQVLLYLVTRTLAITININSVIKSHALLCPFVIVYVFIYLTDRCTFCSKASTSLYSKHGQASLTNINYVVVTAALRSGSTTSTTATLSYVYILPYSSNHSFTYSFVDSSNYLTSRIVILPNT